MNRNYNIEELYILSVTRENIVDNHRVQNKIRA